MTSLILEHRPIEQLKPYPQNPRNNAAVVNKMVAAIQTFGFRIPIVAKSDGTVVDGHLRLKAAKKLGLTTVPVVLADDLNDAQIKAFRLLANRSANWAEWDEALLKIELEELAQLDVDLSVTGFDLEELDRYIQDENPEPFIETVAKVNQPLESTAATVSQQGDLWILGNHRLVCGNSLVQASYTQVLAGEPAQLTVSDPPYNVNYGVNVPVFNKKRRHNQPITNDNLHREFPDFLNQICHHIVAHTQGAIYLCMAASSLYDLREAFVAQGGHCSTIIMWVKHHFSLGYGDYHHQYEPILYGWPQGAEHYWCGRRDQSDVWRIDKPDSNALHPTMKPVELMARAITNSSQTNDWVLDPFGGSGSTLMACEHHRRRCAMIECEPHYVDTIIERWQQHTQQVAIHADSQQSYADRKQSLLSTS